MSNQDNQPIESQLARLLPQGQLPNRDLLFFELGKKQPQPLHTARSFLLGCFATLICWGFFPLQKSNEQPFTQIDQIKPQILEVQPLETYSLLAYRKVLIETNDLPNQILTKNENPIESLQDLQKEFSLYQP